MPICKPPPTRLYADDLPETEHSQNDSLTLENSEEGMRQGFVQTVASILPHLDNGILYIWCMYVCMSSLYLDIKFFLKDPIVRGS